MIHYPDAEGPILVIGAAGIDIVGRAKTELERGTSNPGQVRISHGGVGRNVAENLARLGVDCVLVTAVGDDAQGRQILAHAARAGVDVGSVLTSQSSETGAYLAVLDQEGTLQLGLDHMAAITIITPRELHARRHLFEQAAVLVLDANLPPDSLATTFELAQETGLPVAVDPTSHSLAPKLAPYLDAIWLLSPNEGEAEVLCPLSITHTDEATAIKAARDLVGRGIDIAMITRAEFGVGYATVEGSGQVPALQTEIIDPTGAGDALLATVVFALINEIPVDEAILLGVTAASLTLRTQGSVVPNLSLELLYDHLP